MALLRTIAGKVEFPLLAAILVIAGGLYGFVEMAGIAGAAQAHKMDTQIMLWMRVPGDPGLPIGPPWLPEAVRDVTALGSTLVLSFVVVAVALYLLIGGRAAAALFTLIAVGGGQALSTLLKQHFDRPRPELVPHLVDVYSLSFPSGHAMVSAVTYLTLGALAARIMPGRATKIYVLCLALLTTLAIGASRVYLGVHWPSDVLAGWCAGAAWAMLCWLVAELLLRRERSAAVGS